MEVCMRCRSRRGEGPVVYVLCSACAALSAIAAGLRMPPPCTACGEVENPETEEEP